MFDIRIHKTLHASDRTFVLDTAIVTDQSCAILFGPSGVGKSLTVRATAGLLTPDRGHIKVKEQIFFDSDQGINLTPQARKVGYLLQEYALFPHLSVLNNVGFGLHHGWSNRLTPPMREKVILILEKFEIAHLAHQFPHQLSGGQQQRVAMARALITEPNLLLLDEPFSALDKKLRMHMRDELSAIQSEYAIPMLLITHDEDDIQAFHAQVFDLS
jgi:molybdate transport system ATP-binding protein